MAAWGGHCKPSLMTHTHDALRHPTPGHHVSTGAGTAILSMIVWCSRHQVLEPEEASMENTR